MRKFFRCIGILLLAGIIGVCLLFFSHRSLYPKTDIQKGETMPQHTLTLMSYNTQLMGHYRKTPNNPVIDYLNHLTPDILCLQEVDVFHDKNLLTLNDLKEAFKRYPYSYYDFSIYNTRRQFGNVVFSRYPLINKHTVKYDSQANISSVCDVVIGNDTIRLIANHLESNCIEEKDLDSVIQNRSLEKGDLKQKLQRANTLRRKQAQAICQEVKHSPYPIIVAGDLNSIPLSATYLMLRLHLQDCFLHCSNLSWGTTMPYHHAPLRIDYILCSKEFSPMKFTIEHTDASDHYPITATIAW